VEGLVLGKSYLIHYFPGTWRYLWPKPGQSETSEPKEEVPSNSKSVNKAHHQTCLCRMTALTHITWVKVMIKQFF